MALTVACCLWGSWPGQGWGPEYVLRLRNGVARHLSVPHRFVCFADDVSLVPPGIEGQPLDAPSWKGCLPKLYVYSPQAGLQGRVLLFDLDNVITGPLDDLAAYRGPMAVRAWFRGWDRGERVADGDMIGFEAGSDAAKALWNRLSADPERAEAETGGRERVFIRETVEPDLWQDLLPGQIVSWKNHCRDGLPKGARVVSFHGNPRPHTVRAGWLKEHWS